MEAAVQLVEAHGGSVTVLTRRARRGRGAAPLRRQRRRHRRRAAGRSTGRTGTRSARPARSPTRCGELEADGGPFDLAAVRQRVGRRRWVPGRRARRPRPRAADGQRRQAASTWPRRRPRRPRGRRPGWSSTSCRCRRRRRQGRHQPAALPDHEGPAGVEEGRRRSPRSDAAERRSAARPAARPTERSPRRRSSVTARTPPRPSSTCSSELGVLRVTVLVVVEHDRGDARRRQPRGDGRRAVVAPRRRGSSALTIGAKARRPGRRADRPRRRRGAPGPPRPARRLRTRGVGRDRRPGRRAASSPQRRAGARAPIGATRCWPRRRPASTSRWSPTAPRSASTTTACE